MRLCFSVASISLMVLLVSVGLPGCGGGSSPEGVATVETGTGLPRQVFSAAELEGLLQDSPPAAARYGVPAGTGAALPDVDGEHRQVPPGFTRAARGALRIQEFALDDTPPNYSGFVEVPGVLWRDGQRDFPGGESQGLVRVMTAEYTRDETEFIEQLEIATGARISQAGVTSPPVDTSKYARNDNPWAASTPISEQVRGLF